MTGPDVYLGPLCLAGVHMLTHCYLTAPVFPRSLFRLVEV